VNVDLTRAAWRKSSYSGGSQDCVEVAGGPALILTQEAWQALTRRVKGR
jgi:Domain of unknown function (DUF397)